MVWTIAFYFGRHPIVGRVFYERALENETAIAPAEIAVEKIHGSLLLISGSDDQTWPSTHLSDMAIERLMAHEHPFPFKHLRYEGAGYMITLPNSEPPSWMSRYEVGRTRQANEFANAHSWTKVLDFLGQHLKHRSS
jgi:dienelactone hydrolase